MYIVISVHKGKCTLFGIEEHMSRNQGHGVSVPDPASETNKCMSRNQGQRPACCNHSQEVDDRVVGQRYSANLLNRLVNWVAVTPALTRFTKKSELILCWACVVVGHKMWACRS